MQRIAFFIFIISFVTLRESYAQSGAVTGAIKQTDLTITYFQTSSLIFPFAIESVDRGSGDLLVQKARNVDNVLQVKARRRNMAPTNLTVITADGILYHFPIRYSESPERLTLQLQAVTDSMSAILFQKLTIAEFERDAANILRHAGYSFVKGKERDGITLSIEGIYVRDAHVYYHVHVDNATTLDYDIDQLAFYVRDNRRVKRTAFQEIALTSKFQQGSIHTVRAYAHEDLVICVDKFTLADGRHLTLELSEKKGGRNVSIKLKNRHLLKAIPMAIID